MRKWIQKEGKKRRPEFRLLWSNYGLCGGAYFRSDALRNVIQLVEAGGVDWVKLQRLDPRMGTAVDFSLYVLLGVSGHEVFPWADVSQFLLPPWPTAFLHSSGTRIERSDICMESAITD